MRRPPVIGAVRRADNPHRAGRWITAAVGTPGVENRRSSITATPLVAILLMCFLGSPVCAGERLSVVVVPPLNVSQQTNTDHWRYTIPLLLKCYLRSTHRIRIPPDGSFEFEPDSSVVFALHELKLASTSELTDEQVRSIGQVVEAGFVVWGSYRLQQKEWVLSLQAWDVAAGGASVWAWAAEAALA